MSELGRYHERVRYADRHVAGRMLAEHLMHYRDQHDGLVLALPRGGVPVGYEVAHALNIPLDVLVVRKLGYPGHDEFAMGAVASGGVQVVNEALSFREPGLSSALHDVAEREVRELGRREAMYRAQRPPLALRGKVIILVDDGLATGSSMRAALAAVKAQQPRRVVIAVPVAPPHTCHELASQVDELVCPSQPEPFEAVGLSYRDFDQTSDDEVRALLATSLTSTTHH